MNLRILNEEKDEITVEFDNKDATFSAAIKDELWQIKGVDIATVIKKHPLVGKPHLNVRGKDAKKLLKEAAQSYKKKVEDFEKQIMKEI